MTEQPLNPAAIDDRVDFSQKKAKNGRRAAAEVHRPDGVALDAQNITKKPNELAGGRAVRARADSNPQKMGCLNPAAIDDRVDFSQKKAKNGRRVAAEVHKPDGVALDAQNVTKKSNELTGGRSVRARADSNPQK